jgi:hypothetical protein
MLNIIFQVVTKASIRRQVHEMRGWRHESICWTEISGDRSYFENTLNID